MNPYQELARQHKATKIVNLLAGTALTSERVKGFTPYQWSLIAAAARVKPPSEETRQQVVQLLRDREATL